MRFLLFVPNLSTSIAIPIPKQETHTYVCHQDYLTESPDLWQHKISPSSAHMYIHTYTWMCTCVVDIRCGNLYRGWWGWCRRSRCSRCCYCAAGAVTFGWFDLALVVLVYLNCTSQQGIISFCFLVLPFTATASASFASSNYWARVRAGAFLYPHICM